VRPPECLAAGWGAWAVWTIKPTSNRKDEGPGFFRAFSCAAATRRSQINGSTSFGFVGFSLDAVQIRGASRICRDWLRTNPGPNLTNQSSSDRSVSCVRPLGAKLPRSQSERNGAIDREPPPNKCTEYLTSKRACFSDRYEKEIKDERASGPWFAEMRRLRIDCTRYKLLDAAQLIKHAFGLARPSTGVSALIYLYWEPIDASRSALFQMHRDEIAAFAEQVTGGNPSFESMSYSELWKAWTAGANSRLKEHAANLRQRYDVAAFAGDAPFDVERSKIAQQ
jgi:hypothetical protein